MKKIILTGIILMCIISLSGATSGVINLTGTVNASTAITVTEVNLPLDLTVSVMDLKVGTINEKSNKNGYSIELTSANSGKLVGETLSEEQVYIAKYDGVAVTLSSTAVEILASGSKTSGVDKDFVISYTIVEYVLVPDVYSDILTFTIIAN